MPVTSFPLNPKPVDAIAKRALSTLVDIGTYVDSTTFCLDGLARGLGRADTEELRAELEWLRAQGFVEAVAPNRASLKLTHKGRSYEEEAPEESSADD